MCYNVGGSWKDGLCFYGDYAMFRLNVDDAIHDRLVCVVVEKCI